MIDVELLEEDSNRLVRWSAEVRENEYEASEGMRKRRADDE